jgi:hypothetical protein
MIGKTFVSDAAASTVGPEPVEAAGVEDVVAGVLAAGVDAVVAEAVVLLLLPQPAARTETPSVAASAPALLALTAFNTGTSLIRRQNPSTILGSWHGAAHKAA